MKLFIKILPFVLLSLIVNVNGSSATITFSNIQKITIYFSFQDETPKTIYKVIENDLVSCYQNGNNLLTYDTNLTASGIMQAATGKRTETLTYQGIKGGSKKLGASDATADAIASGVDNGISLSSGLGALTTSSGKISTAIATEDSAAKGVPALRTAYVKEVEGLSSIASKMRSGGSSSEEIARTLHGLRRELGVNYKSLTPDNVLQQIYQRNLQKYGDKLGPTIDYLRQQGKSWDDIINSATRTGGKDLGF